MRLNTMFTPLLLVKVVDLSALVVPMSVVGKVMLRGVSEIGMLPVPVIWKPITLPFVAVISNCAFAFSDAVGSKVTENVHEAPAARVPPAAGQVLVWAKSVE